MPEREGVGEGGRTTGKEAECERLLDLGAGGERGGVGIRKHREGVLLRPVGSSSNDQLSELVSAFFERLTFVLVASLLIPRTQLHIALLMIQSILNGSTLFHLGAKCSLEAEGEGKEDFVAGRWPNEAVVELWKQSSVVGGRKKDV